MGEGGRVEGWEGDWWVAGAVRKRAKWECGEVLLHGGRGVCR